LVKKPVKELSVFLIDMNISSELVEKKYNGWALGKGKLANGFCVNITNSSESWELRQVKKMFTWLLKRPLPN